MGSSCARTSLTAAGDWCLMGSSRTTAVLGVWRTRLIWQMTSESPPVVNQLWKFYKSCHAHIEIVSVKVLKFYRYRPLARVCIVHVADPVSSEIGMSVL